MKTVLVLQAFGMGDCIWAQSIAHHFIDQGYSVVWPVKLAYYWQLVRSYPKINWVPDSIVKPELFNIKEKIEVDGMLVAPIRWSDSYMKVPYKYVMRAKFDMYDLDWREWKKHAMWDRHTNKEVQVMKLMEMTNGEPYNIVNKRFASNGSREVDIDVKNDFQNIEMCELPGYSLFDWAAAFECASEIHSVSTSVLYMFELLDLKCPIHLYPRKPLESDLSFVDYIFTKPYIVHP